MEKPTTVKASVDNTQAEAWAQQRPAFPELFSIPEAISADSQTTQATDRSVLRQRDPNPQSRTHIHSAKKIKDIPLPSVEPGDDDIENGSTSIILAFTHSRF